MHAATSHRAGELMRHRAVRSLELPDGHSQRQRADRRGDGANECRVSNKVEAARADSGDIGDNIRLNIPLLRAICNPGQNFFVLLNQG